MPIGRFIAGISALIWSPQMEKYLLLRRAGSKDFGAGTWECVTGRLDQGEGFPEAALREVQEELEIEVTLDFMIGTVHFYRGQPIPENELIGVVYHCTYDDPNPFQLSQEHDDYRWVTAAEAQSFLPPDHWLLPFIHRAEILRPLVPPGSI